MTLLDRISDRVGDFLEDVMLPDEIRSLHASAEEAIEAGDYHRALEDLGEAEHRRPQTERTRRLRGLCHFHLDHTDKAANLFGQALEMREEPASHFYLGLCLERMERFDESRTHLLRARTLNDDPPFGFELYFALGRIYLALERPDKAVRELRRALRRWPDEPQATLTLARSLIALGDVDDAARQLRDLVGDDLQGADPDILLELADSHLHNHQPQHAVDAYEALLERQPDHLPALLGAARAHLDLHRPHRANQWLLRALESSDDSADIYALIGDTNARIQNLNKARESYRSALRRDPKHPRALLGIARLDLDADDAQKALDHYRALCELHHPRFQGPALLGAARAHLALDEPAEARQLLHKADDRGLRDTADHLFVQGLIALHTGDPAEALVALRRARQQTDDQRLMNAIDEAVDDALKALTPDWSPPESPQSTADLLADLEALVDLLRDRPRLDPFRPRVHLLINELTQPLSVAIVGEFNAGKSTLINALLGEEVVPMGVLPTTAHPCIMAYGPRKGVRIHYGDGRLVDVDFATARRLMKDEAASIDRLHYTYPHPALRSINYWDTPGFNALDDRHESLAGQALGDAEAILWLLDANQALKQSELDRLDTIEDPDQRVLLVLNKIDRFGDADQRQDSVDEILDYLRDSIGDQVLHIFPISAREALQAQTQDPDPTPPDAFTSLKERIDLDFVQRSSDLKIGETLRQLKTLLDDLRAFRAHHIEAFDGHLQTLSSLQSDIQQYRQDPHTWAGEHRARLADQLDFLALGVAREFDQALQRQGRILQRTVLDPEDQRFLLDLYSHRLTALLERQEQTILDEIARVDDAISRRTDPLLSALDPGDARTIRRGLDALFDELRHQRQGLHDRAFRPWLARAEGQIDAAGPHLLDQLANRGDEHSAEQRQQQLLRLLPDLKQHLSPALQAWYADFFVALERFCDRLYRDLETLSLEFRHRLDIPHLPSDTDPPE